MTVCISFFAAVCMIEFQLQVHIQYLESQAFLSSICLIFNLFCSKILQFVHFCQTFPSPKPYNTKVLL